jgi:hypothetical protein
VCGLLHRLDLLLHWLESGSEYSGGQLGYVVATADSGFDALLDQLCCNSMNSTGFFTAESAGIAAVRLLAFFVAKS